MTRTQSDKSNNIINSAPERQSCQVWFSIIRNILLYYYCCVNRISFCAFYCIIMSSEQFFPVFLSYIVLINDCAAILWPAKTYRYRKDQQTIVPTAENIPEK